LKHASGLLLAILIGASAREVAAQDEPRDCAERSAIVLRSKPERRIPNLVLYCPVSGPITLAQLWSRSKGMTPEERSELRHVSGSMRDARLFEAVLGVVRSPRFALEDRFAALSVLLQYYDKSYGAIDAGFLADSGSFKLVPQMTHAPAQFHGAQKLPGDARRMIAEEVAQRAWTDEDETFRRVAHRVRAALARMDPQNTPVREGSIALIAGCGRRVTLRSTADIGLPIEVRVLGTSFVYPKGIRDGTETKPAEILLAFPPGVVVATLGDRELARLEERNAPCPPGMPR
jgi:hypothetical protein